MIRFVTLIVIVAVFGGVQMNLSLDKLLHMILDVNNPNAKAIFDKCFAAGKLSPADIEALQQLSSDLSQEGKCTIACALTGLGLLSADGKNQKDVFLSQAETMTKGDAAKLKQATEIYENCEKSVSGSDVCEIAFMWADCFKKEIIARNIPLDI